MKKWQFFKQATAIALSAAVFMTSFSLPAGTNVALANEPSKEEVVFAGGEIPAQGEVNAEGAAEEDSALIYRSDKSVSKNGIVLGDEENWTDSDSGGQKYTIAYDESISNSAITENFTVSANVILDETSYNNLGNDGYLKIQSVVKVGDDWTWTDTQDIRQLNKNDFESTGKGYSGAVVASFTDKEPADLKGVYFVVVGTKFNGTVTFSDVEIRKAEKEEETSEVEVYSNSEGKSAEFDFSDLAAENWDNMPTITYDASGEDVTLAKSASVKGKVTIDEQTYSTLADEGSYIKLQSVIKVGKADDWTQSEEYPYLDKNAFTKTDSGYTADFSAAHPEIAGGKLYEVVFRVAGLKAKGTLTVSDVKVFNVISGEAPLPEKDPTVVDDFESAEPGTANGWENEEGYKYDAVIEPQVVKEVTEENDTNMLKLNLDYTGKGGESWSEAKVKKSFAEGLDISAYNLITYELIYPSDLKGKMKAKVFAKNSDSDTELINKDVTIDNADDLAGGMVRSKITVKFSPNETPITDLTIGVVGVNTEFKGDIYLDNIILSQYNAAADFVDITVSANAAGTQADISQMPAEVQLTDTNATAATKALYAYLQGLDEADQVLFGHQNDTHKKVTSREGVYSDTKDMTGSIAGLVGIDSLALTGTELGIKDTDEAIAEAVRIGKAAAAEGAILTLSTHMPNMSNEKIKATPEDDRPYDFSECDFNESKDLTNNCAEEVLPGGKYNAQFKAYLDIIADYANGLDGIPVLFRPFHENTGGWFWWGSATTSRESYNAMFRYTRDYLESKGVHNFIYVYSPNGPLTSKETYMSRYPGDDCVDIIAFDYYDDYNTYPAEYSADFMDNLRRTCEVVKEIAEEKGKVAAISETGVRVMKADGSDNEGLLVKDNPIKGQNWYSKVNTVAKETGMPYFLLWANFSDTNFYVPYKYSDTKGHELINEFIEFYNEDSSVFANGTNFYDNAEEKTVTNTMQPAAAGYFTNVFSKSVIKNATTIEAVVKNAGEVSVVLANGDRKVTVEAEAVSGNNVYAAEVTADDLTTLGQTDVGTVALIADGKELAKLNFVSFGKDKDKLPANVVDNFELYYGDNDYLDGAYSENSAANCFSKFELDETNKKSGKYGGSFHYGLKTNGSEGWTGRKKSLDVNNFSAYNALSMWVKPDGKGQKLVIQLVSGGEDFEVYLTDFVKTTEAKYVVIPFDSFRGKNGGTFNAENVTAFAVWCNSIPANGSVDIDSEIVFDDIQFIKTDLNKLTLTAGGYALSDKADGTNTQTVDDGGKPQPAPTPAPTPAKVGTTLKTSNAAYVVTDSAKKTISYAGPLNKKTKSVTIPKQVAANGVTYEVTAIKAKAFYNCKKLTKITIPETVETIGANAFAKCTALKKITIPKKVTTIDKSAFSGCKKLKSITIKSTVLKKVGSKAFKGIDKKATIKVPKKQLKKYQKLLKGKGQAKTVKIKK